MDPATTEQQLKEKQETAAPPPPPSQQVPEGVEVVNGQYVFKDGEGISYEWDSAKQAWFPMVFFSSNSIRGFFIMKIFFSSSLVAG